MQNSHWLDLRLPNPSPIWLLVHRHSALRHWLICHERTKSGTLSQLKFLKSRNPLPYCWSGRILAERLVSTVSLSARASIIPRLFGLIQIMRSPTPTGAQARPRESRRHSRPPRAGDLNETSRTWQAGRRSNAKPGLLQFRPRARIALFRLGKRRS